jgi:hypothetical protein
MLSISRVYSFEVGMINECGTVGGMRIGKGKQTIRRKPAPALLIHTKVYMS